MTLYLISLSIGPVQEFIAAARKTADLSAGSDLLVKVVGAAASEFSAEERIFPVNTDQGGANKILALVHTDPAQRTARAKAAAQQVLRAEWQRASSMVPGLLLDEAAEAQMARFLELYAAWTPVQPEHGGYSRARKRVERLLAGRKALRDFEAFDQHDTHIQKSPLDPAFACVVRLEQGRIPERVLGEKTLLKLKASEFLDAISLLKRIRAGQSQPVPSTHTLAERALNLNADLYSGHEEESLPRYPYYAILVADGDHMGKLIAAKDTEEAHRTLSAQLDNFAGQAKTLVEKCGGSCAYAGGDDVLALLPVTTAVACAQELSEAFQRTVRGTLSAGIAIVHYREPLSLSLAWARKAEKAAKNAGRNRLCLALHTRGGSPLIVTQPWEDLKQLNQWQELNRSGHLTRGLPYELRELAREWPAEDFEMPLLKAEAERILKRKQAKEGHSKDGKTEPLKIPDFAHRSGLTHFADLLILARFLSGRGLHDAPAEPALPENSYA